MNLCVSWLSARRWRRYYSPLLLVLRVRGSVLCGCGAAGARRLVGVRRCACGAPRRAHYSITCAHPRAPVLSVEITLCG
jgi:hypothetical protein